MKKVAALGLLAVLVCRAFAQSDDATLTILHKQAQECGKATLDGNYEKLADMTYPKFVDLLGGKEKFAETTKNLMSALKAKGITVKSVKTSPAKEVHSAGENMFGVVPMVT